MKTLFLFLLTAFILLHSAPALAQGPTNTPPAPTATSPYANLRNTPTPFQITPMAIGIDTSGQAGEIRGQFDQLLPLDEYRPCH